MLGGLVAAYAWPAQLPFLSASGRFVFRDAGVVLIAGTSSALWGCSMTSSNSMR